MKKSSVLATKFAGAGALALLLATSAFADNRPQDGTRPGGDYRDGRVSRDSRGGNAQSGDHRNDLNRGGSRTQADTRNGGNQAGTRNGGNQAGTRNGGNQAGTRNGGNQAGTRNGGNQADTRNGGYQTDTRNRSNQADQAAVRNDRNSSEGSRGGSYDRGRSESSRQYRNNERVSMQGRISRYAHERGGYRVWFDNGGYSFWVPEARWRNDWRVGIGISLGGIFRGGVIYADVYDDPYYDNGGYGDNRGYSNDYVTGYVDRVDYRTGTLSLRDDRTGRFVTVDTRSIDPRYSRIDGRDLRRGDRVTLTGSWLRNGLFAANGVDSVDTRRD